jgi:hypothetical protein
LSSLHVGPPGTDAIASAIAAAARGPDAPQVGRATFEARLDALGRIVSVRLANAAAGDARAWASVAKNAARSLMKRSFALGPAFARGAKVAVNVIAEMALPSGQTSLFDPKRIPLPKPRLPDDVSRAGRLSHASDDAPRRWQRTLEMRKNAAPPRLEPGSNRGGGLFRDSLGPVQYLELQNCKI